MKTSSAKAKGRNLQKWVVAKILATWSTLTSNDVRSTSMGNQGVDIQLSEAAMLKFPWAVECKNQQKLKQVYDMWDQAIENAKPPLHPLLVIKMNNRKPLAVMDFETFMSMVN